MSSRVCGTRLALSSLCFCSRQAFGAILLMVLCQKQMPTLMLPTSCQIFQGFAPVGSNSTN